MTVSPWEFEKGAVVVDDFVMKEIDLEKRS